MLHGQSLLSWDALTSIVLLFDLELLPPDYFLYYLPKEMSDFTPDVFEISGSVYELWYNRATQRSNGGQTLRRPLIYNMEAFQSLACWDHR
jgi:hypothetical protein